MNEYKRGDKNIFASIYKLENNELPKYFNKYIMRHLDLHGNNTINKLVLKNRIKK